MDTICRACSEAVENHVTCSNCANNYHPSCVLKIGGMFVSKEGQIYCCKKEKFEEDGEINERIALYKILCEEMKSKNEILHECKSMQAEKIALLETRIKHLENDTGDRTSHDNIGQQIVNNINTACNDNLSQGRVKSISYRDVLVINSKHNEMNKEDARKKLLSSGNANILQKVNITDTKKGGLKVECFNKSEVAAVKESLIQILGTDYLVKEYEKKCPCIRVSGIHKSINKDDLIHHIKTQNDLSENNDELHLRVIRLFKVKDDLYNALVETDPRSFQSIMKNKYVFVGLNRCKVQESFNVLRCYKCHGFGHKADACKVGVICSKCSMQHNYKECTSDIEMCNNCLQRNNKFGTNFSTQHSAWHTGCQCYIDVLEVIKSKVNYNCEK